MSPPRILFSLLSCTTILIDTWGPLIYQHLLFPHRTVAWREPSIVDRGHRGKDYDSALGHLESFCSTLADSRQSNMTDSLHLFLLF